MKIIRVVYVIFGSLFLGIGLIGVFIPLLPTTPFLLLTAFCYAKGSKRFHDWFVSTWIYKKHLESFVTSRSMKLKTKLVILGSASVMLLFPLILTNNIIVRIIIIFLYFYKYFYFFKYIKTIPNDSPVEYTEKDK